MKRHTIAGILIAGVGVGIGHFVISGMESVVVSTTMGLAGGFGALAMDVFLTFSGRFPPASSGDSSIGSPLSRNKRSPRSGLKISSLG